MIKAENFYMLDLPAHSTVDNTTIIEVGNCIEVIISMHHIIKSTDFENGFYDFGYNIEKNQTNKLVICFDHNVKIKEYKFIGTDKTLCPYLKIILEVNLEGR